jgi:hypothetical protein
MILLIDCAHSNDSVSTARKDRWKAMRHKDGSGDYCTRDALNFNYSYAKEVLPGIEENRCIQ